MTARRGAVAILGLALAAGVAVLIVELTHHHRRAGSADNGAPTGVATVQRRTLASQQQVDGTLRYAGSYGVVNQASGTFTQLPATGQVIRPGHVLYHVSGKPILLLSGHTPAYRALSTGTSGRDVLELNEDLVALGYATRDQLDPTSDYFGSATRYALERLQHHFGLEETGTLALGDAVFEPGALRVTSVTASLGAAASPGTPLLQASSTTREVSVKLDATQQSSVAKGDRVAITLPDESVTSGVVSHVGTVATTPSGSGDPGSDSTPTINLSIEPLHPRATGKLDQAPVQVAITTASVPNALVVPVSALLARPSGYAVEIAGETRRLVPVRLGLFDDAEGLVQVSGAGLAPGQRVVVPSSS